jgi:hypothetical protein
LNENIGEIAGVRNVKTTKSRNINVYTDTGPVINNIIVDSFNDSEQTTPIKTNVVFDSEISYPAQPTRSYIEFDLNVSSIANLSGLRRDENGVIIPDFEAMQLTTGEISEIVPELVSVDGNILRYKLYLKSADVESDNTSIITTAEGGRATNESAYSIYAKFKRAITVDGESKTLDLECFTNKIRYAITAYRAPKDNEPSSPSRFKISTYIDDFSQSTIDLKDTLDTAAAVISSEPVWEISNSVYSLSFAKFTNSLINGRDFDTIGAGYVTIEDFCFPALYRDISSIITINDEFNSTFSINF